MKSVTCFHEEGYVCVKVFLKRDSQFDSKRYREKLQELRAKFLMSEHPSIITLQMIDETGIITL